MNLPESAIEPPLSPAPLGGLRRAPLPGEESESPALSGPPPLPNRLLRMGLVTLPQLSAAMQEQAATGRQLTDILLEAGLISADDLAKLDEPAAVAPPPAPEPAYAPPLAPEASDTVSQALFAPAPEASDTVSQALFAPAPEVALAQAPVQAPVQVAPPVPAPVPSVTALRLAVVAQLENGTRIELGVFGDEATAREAATQAMRAVRHATEDWPLLGGRYVRPQSVLSIEVAALL
jgi:hypothetical protein